MEHLKNIFKLKILFSQEREDCDHREEVKIEWSSIYKTKIIYNHSTIFSNIDDLLEQIKPYLYYLSSKNVNREGDRYIFGTELVVGLFWKSQKPNGEYRYKYIRIAGFLLDNIESNLNLKTFYPIDDISHVDLKKPFEIHINILQEYNLEILESEEEMEYLYEKMVDLDEEKAKIPTIVAKMGIQDPEERLDKYEELLASIGYNSYFQYRPHLLSDSALIILIEYASEAQEESIDDYISTVLYFSNMEESWEKEPENALIINYNKKLHF